MIVQPDPSISFLGYDREDCYKGMSTKYLLQMAEDIKHWEPDTLKLLLPLLESIQDDMQRLDIMIIFYRSLHELEPESRVNVMMEYVRSV